MVGYPHMNNLLFAMPLTGRPIPPDVMFAYHTMVHPMNYNNMVMQIKGQPIDKARNQFAEQAISSNVRYLFFWDEDVACPPQTIPELIYKMEHHPEAAVIGGIYCLKRHPAEPLVFRGNGNGPYWDWKAGEFFEISGIGMGCTMIRVDVFRDLKKPWFSTYHNYKPMMDGESGVEAWSEDLWFCDRVVKTNKWKIYADASLICAHYDMTTCEGFTLPPDSKPVQHLQVPRGKLKILDLGSGASPYQTREGFIVRADPDEKAKPDYRVDLRKLPFATGEYDIVFSPALEQYEETEEILTEWLRCLKSGGELRLVVSDVEWGAKELIAGRIQPIQLYGAKKLAAFTFASLEKILADLEMVEIEKVKSDPAHIAVRAKRK